MKVKVWIEEHLVKEVEVECPDDMSIDERMEYAQDKVLKQYKDGDIVLTADDYTGTTFSVEDVESDSSTEWKEI